MLLIVSHNGKSNWVPQVKRLLEMTGFGHVWLNSGVENDKLFLFNFKQRLRDNFGQKVNLELQATSRGTFYELYNSLWNKSYPRVHFVKKSWNLAQMTSEIPFLLSDIGQSLLTSFWPSNLHISKMAANWYV